jgi:hypothetical protein
MKVKCDEAWPCCSACARANAQCSGPPDTHKFIYNGNHHAENNINEGTTCQSIGLSTTQQAVLFPLDSFKTSNGASFARLRLSSGGPRRNLSTVADRVAARFGMYLSGKDDSNMLAHIDYVKYLPSRLQHSAALRDSLALFISALINSKRNVSPAEVVDRKLYGKAIRSLQYALNNSESLTCETLAATTILDRFEMAFDGGSIYRAVHASGVRSLTMKRGPPNLENEMDVQLALKNLIPIVRLSKISGHSTR